MQRTSIRTLPELSARYVEAVLRVKSSGPYCLLGMCTGAQMALEMARQLTAAGHSVPLVCILDTYALYTVSKWRFAAYRSLQRSRYYVNRVRELLRQPRDEWVRELARVAVRNRSSAPVAAVPAPAGAAIPAARAGTQGAVPGHEPDTAAADEAEWAWLGEFGLGENDPHLPKHREPVLVLRCPRQDQWWRVPSDSLGWAGQASDVRVERIEGCVHDAVLREPHVQEVARLVANHLDTLPDSRGEAMTQ